MHQISANVNIQNSQYCTKIHEHDIKSIMFTTTKLLLNDHIAFTRDKISIVYQRRNNKRMVEQKSMFRYNLLLMLLFLE